MADASWTSRPSSGIALDGCRGVEVGRGRPDDVALGLDLGARRLLGRRAPRASVGLPRGDLLLQLPVLAGLREQRALRGQREAR